MIRKTGPGPGPGLATIGGMGVRTRAAALLCCVAVPAAL
ncbi:MAG: hypothetical protein QOF84_5696, partial [Streptomyces sp.]|nr:hypothetical protein [Streptomyces sp.]MDX6350906.1 hypothetical protein [Streptomyces sp.]